MEFKAGQSKIFIVTQNEELRSWFKAVTVSSDHVEAEYFDSIESLVRAVHKICPGPENCDSGGIKGCEGCGSHSSYSLNQFEPNYNNLVLKNGVVVKKKEGLIYRFKENERGNVNLQTYYSYGFTLDAPVLVLENKNTGMVENVSRAFLERFFDETPVGAYVKYAYDISIKIADINAELRKPETFQTPGKEFDLYSEINRMEKNRSIALHIAHSFIKSKEI